MIATNNNFPAELNKPSECEKHPRRRVWEKDGCVHVFVPISFRKRNGKRRIIVANSRAAKQKNTPLAEAIAKAYRWQELLESGQYTNLQDIAHAVGVDRSYVSRLLPLTSLAPDIIETILAGNEPDGMSLAYLHKGIPVRWDQQRELWLTGRNSNPC